MDTSLEICNITKIYPGVTALDNVSLSFKPGEIHALMGENGAGKSTLIKIIAGAEYQTGGKIIIDGKEYTELTPSLSKKIGISVIYQELSLVPALSVAENVFLGDKVGGKYIVNFKEMRRKAAEIFEDLNIDIDVTTPVENLTISQQQIIEIAKAISKDTRILIMDEPSAALAVAEVKHMFQVMKKLKSKGITIIYISHRIDEVFSIADRVSVLRDGKYIATEKIEDLTHQKLIKLMVGRQLSEAFPQRVYSPGKAVLEVDGLTGNGVRDISFKLHKGEILGMAGLIGAGRTELAKVIYGAALCSSGKIKVHGKQLQIKSPSQAVGIGIGLIPENRKEEGIFLGFQVNWNITIMNIKSFSKYMVVSKREINKTSKKYAEQLHLKTPSLEQLVRNLSGGNQQKVVLAKTLAANTEIIIFDEPTRGIDVGAKQEIYRLMNDLAENGVSIIMISSDMEELLGMSDRIIVMHEGSLSGEIVREEFNQDKILAMASGV